MKKKSKLALIGIGLSFFWEVVVINGLVQYILSNSIRIFFYRRTGMHVGKNTSLFRGCYFQNLGGISFGDNCIIGFRCRFNGYGKIKVGNNVVISSETILETGSHDYVTYDRYFKPITIEDNAWVATRALILQGVTIGEGAIVGAGSVVTNDVPPYAIVAGVPAKMIGSRPKKIDYKLKFRPWFF